MLSWNSCARFIYFIPLSLICNPMKRYISVVQREIEIQNYRIGLTESVDEC